ncbi:MAG: hypothetical protein IIA00_07370 [Proteobacteria bacterium]|nr:hypothetical protein [Pseudomonadota bacterium]
MMLAATEDVIKARLRQLKCVHVGDTITAHIYKTSAEVHFHVPKPLYGVFGYSSDQVSLIADQLERVGIDLLPLDFSL